MSATVSAFSLLWVPVSLFSNSSSLIFPFFNLFKSLVSFSNSSMSSSSTSEPCWQLKNRKLNSTPNHVHSIHLNTTEFYNPHFARSVQAGNNTQVLPRKLSNSVTPIENLKSNNNNKVLSN